MEFSISSYMFRLERWSPEKNRPLLVTFKELEMRDTIISNLKKTQGSIEKFRGAGISPDLHPRNEKT